MSSVRRFTTRICRILRLRRRRGGVGLPSGRFDMRCGWSFGPGTPSLRDFGRLHSRFTRHNRERFYLVGHLSDRPRAGVERQIRFDRSWML